jgi:HlyD family secretion protein
MEDAMHKLRRIVPPIILILIIISVTVWYFVGKGRAAGGGLQASGTVEAVEVQIGAELAGRVAEIFVDKGDLVKAGDQLFRLDDELLQAQYKRAAAALDAAQSNLTTAQTGLDAAESAVSTAETALELAKASSQTELLTAQKALDDLNENADFARSNAEREVAAASRAVREATYQLDNFTIPTEQAGLTAMEALDLMKQRLDEARQAFEPYRNASSGDTTRQDRKDDLDAAQSDYDAAVRRMEYETQVDLAQSRLDKALLDLEKLKDGPNPDDLAILNSRIDAIKAAPQQAEAALAQAKVGVEQAQSRLDGAGKAVEQAQAEVDLIEVQLKKLAVLAPISGVILSRNLEPGEFVQPGAAVMAIGQLDSLTITVFIPEDRYGQIKLGEAATVNVDSFPGESFPALVDHIADQAEFTPRNVQTVEGRRTTVFAIDLSIENPEGKLKPGMPADVRFGE